MGIIYCAVAWNFILTQWDLNKMADILQMRFWNTFFRKEYFLFSLSFRWNLVIRFHLTINCHWCTQVMAWCQASAKLLSKPMITQFTEVCFHASPVLIQDLVVTEPAVGLAPSCVSASAEANMYSFNFSFIIKKFQYFSYQMILSKMSTNQQDSFWQIKKTDHL